jgi:alanine racemase
MFAGFSAQAIPTLLDNELTPTLHNAAVAQAVSDAARKPTSVYVKVDCGLWRLGVSDEEAESFVKWVAALPNLVVEGLYTHVPFQTVAGRERTRPALRRFEELVERLREGGLPVPITQAAASSTLLAGMDDGCSAVCPGHLLYGLLPFDESCGPIAPYRPVVTALKTRLIHIGSSATGERIEGSYRFASAPDGERLHRWGVVPFGLADGYRQPTPASEVLVRGRRTSVLGVGLEHTIVDLTGADAELGDTVVVLGDAGPDSISLAELAGGLGASPLELLVGLSGRVDRVLTGESAPR